MTDTLDTGFLGSAYPKKETRAQAEEGKTERRNKKARRYDKGKTISGRKYASREAEKDRKARAKAAKTADKRLRERQADADFETGLRARVDKDLTPAQAAKIREERRLSGGAPSIERRVVRKQSDPSTWTDAERLAYMKRRQARRVKKSKQRTRAELPRAQIQLRKDGPVIRSYGQGDMDEALGEIRKERIKQDETEPVRGMNEYKRVLGYHSPYGGRTETGETTESSAARFQSGELGAYGAPGRTIPSRGRRTPITDELKQRQIDRYWRSQGIESQSDIDADTQRQLNEVNVRAKADAAEMDRMLADAAARGRARAIADTEQIRGRAATDDSVHPPGTMNLGAVDVGQIPGGRLVRPPIFRENDGVGSPDINPTPPGGTAYTEPTIQPRTQERNVEPWFKPGTQPYIRQPDGTFVDNPAYAPPTVPSGPTLPPPGGPVPQYNPVIVSPEVAAQEEREGMVRLRAIEQRDRERQPVTPTPSQGIAGTEQPTATELTPAERGEINRKMDQWRIVFADPNTDPGTRKEAAKQLNFYRAQLTSRTSPAGAAPVAPPVTAGSSVNTKAVADAQLQYTDASMTSSYMNTASLGLGKHSPYDITTNDNDEAKRHLDVLKSSLASDQNPQASYKAIINTKWWNELLESIQNAEHIAGGGISGAGAAKGYAAGSYVPGIGQVIGAIAGAKPSKAKMETAREYGNTLKKIRDMVNSYSPASQAASIQPRTSIPGR